MTSDPVIEKVARATHACWCARMRSEGWRTGPAYSAEARTHDALVDFDALSFRDRRQVVQLVDFEGIAERLAEIPFFERGPDREFLLDEMRPGLPVRFALPDRRKPGHDPLGRVESWRTEDGDLSDIRVRWEDGSVSEHHAAARELRRDGEPPVDSSRRATFAL